MSMKILKKSPTDWKDLEKKTAKYLDECGYSCEVQKDIGTVRGIVNVDVYATYNVENPASTILCECKYWKSAIPQTIVHSFRTITSDFGANYGIIVSKIGFQKGAIEATENSNILLFDWDQFQDYFKTKWFKQRSLNISKISKPLFDYTSVGFRVFFKNEYNELNTQEKEEFELLIKKYFNVVYYSKHLNYSSAEAGEFNLELFESLVENAKVDFQTDFSSYEEFYDYLKSKISEGLIEFDDFFNKQLRR